MSDEIVLCTSSQKIKGNKFISSRKVHSNIVNTCRPTDKLLYNKSERSRNSNALIFEDSHSRQDLATVIRLQSTVMCVLVGLDS